MSFSELGLSAELLRAIDDQGYPEPTPIQAKAIPTILTGQDVLAGAQTGTGKTAGFTLPLLQLLSESHSTSGKRKIRALVLTPTRELAAQIGDSVTAYGKHLPIKSTVIFGGVGINPQIDKLRKGVDVLIATPGRLLDHANQKTLSLGDIEYLVLDEADRMLDMGFIHDIRKVLALLPPRHKRQNLLFSATFSNDIKSLANKLLNEPTLIEVAPRNATADRIKQTVYPVDKSSKRSLLSHLIQSQDWQQVLVFTRTKHGANRLAQQLTRDGLNSAAIHGNKSQGARTRALAEFKNRQVRVLIATDIAARGLDIEQLPHVVNYELPNVPEDYVHRIGRTARAGQSGEAASLVAHEEGKLLRDIERLVKLDLPRVIVPGFEPGDPAANEPSTNNNNNNNNNNSNSNSNNSSRPRSRAGGQRTASGNRNGNGNGNRNGNGNGNQNGQRSSRSGRARRRRAP